MAYHDSQRHHKALRNMTPGDVWFDRREQILARRKALQIWTLVARREHYRHTVKSQANDGNQESGTSGL